MRCAFKKHCEPAKSGAFLWQSVSQTAKNDLFMHLMPFHLRQVPALPHSLLGPAARSLPSALSSDEETGSSPGSSARAAKVANEAKARARANGMVERMTAASSLG